MLERFLPPFNTRFRVQAAQPESAYRQLDPALDLDAVLAFHHPRTVTRHNTVKYGWRILHLLPGRERTSYAGARVEVVERPDGDLSVRHHGEPIALRLGTVHISPQMCQSAVTLRRGHRPDETH